MIMNLWVLYPSGGSFMISFYDEKTENPVDM